MAGLFLVALPAVGIPRAQILPPSLIYTQATGRASGVVTEKTKEETSNPFRSGTKVYRVNYSFYATVPPALGAAKVGKREVYTGSLYVPLEMYDALKKGDTVPVRFERSYPVISGITLPGGGRSTAQGSGMVSGWLLYLGGVILTGYMIAPLLERVMLRESY